MVVLVSSLGIFIFGANKANAAIENMPIPVIGHIIGVVLWIIETLLAKLLYLAANLADIILGMTQFTKVSIVTIGWTITRDLANMFFVLILLVIAIATILRVETYGMKNLLPKLIIAALLINFSLVIAGAIIDFTQVLTNFFIESAAGEKNVSVIIMEGLQVHELYEHDDALASIFLKTFLGPSIAQLMESAFAVAILMTAVFAFCALGFFLIVRIVILWLLLILAPIVWLLMVIPQTESMWKNWWSSFLKWSFFAPIYAFFLYITLTAIQSKVIVTEITKGIDLTEGAVFSSIFASNPQIILQYIFIILMLLGGLVVAQKTGAYGAGGTMNLAKNIGKRSAKLGWRGTKASVGIAGKIPGINRIPKAEQMKKGIMSQVEKIPLVGKAIGGPGAYAATQTKKIKEERGKISSRTNNDLEAIKKQTVFTKEDRTRKVAAMAELAERGKLNGSYQENENDLKMFEQSGGKIDDIFEKRPDWLGDYQMNVKGLSSDEAANNLQKMINELTPTKAGKIQAESFGDLAVQKSFVNAMKDNGPLGATHISAIATNNPKTKAKIDTEIFGSSAYKKDIKQGIKDWLKNSPGNVQFYGTTETQAAPAPTPTPTPSK